MAGECRKCLAESSSPYFSNGLGCQQNLVTMECTSSNLRLMHRLLNATETDQ